MKTCEVRGLRNENVRLSEKLEEFDKISNDLKKAEAQVEDLKEQIKAKVKLHCTVRHKYFYSRQIIYFR